MGRQPNGCHNHGADLHDLGPNGDLALAETVRKPAAGMLKTMKGTENISVTMEMKSRAAPARGSCQRSSRAAGCGGCCRCRRPGTACDEAQNPRVLRGASAGAEGGSPARTESVVVIKECCDSVVPIVSHWRKSSVESELRANLQELANNGAEAGIEERDGNQCKANTMSVV